jgi:cytochrome c oxidase subunit 3
MKFQPHPYHLVEPSPWPLTGSIALLITTFSAVCYFHGYGHGGVFLTIGLLCVLSTMGLWWADVIREGNIFNKNVPSINLTICWKLLRAFDPLS